jgi:hypothetical protein
MPVLLRGGIRLIDTLDIDPALLDRKLMSTTGT